jgi:hypothetical protein
MSFIRYADSQKTGKPIHIKVKNDNEPDLLQFFQFYFFLLHNKLILD